jgi:signal transduction histidine kinase
MDILHRVPNLVGTIPLRAETIIRRLKERSGETDLDHVIGQIEGIKRDAETLLHSVKKWDPYQEAMKQMPEDIGLLLNSALHNTLIPENVEVEKDFEENMPCVLCNPKELFESFRCIIENGFQAMMPNGGKLTIRASKYDESQYTWIRVTIADTGHGIIPDNLPKVFELGFTTKESGLGYGLWRSRVVVEKIGGNIRAESTIGQGTIFVINLPGASGEECNE